jgi:hypothetical protein
VKVLVERLASRVGTLADGDAQLACHEPKKISAPGGAETFHRRAIRRAL